MQLGPEAPRARHSHAPPPPSLPAQPPPAQEAEEQAGKQRAAHARALEGLREGLARRAAEVAARIERSSRKAGKMPELAQVLLPFLD